MDLREIIPTKHVVTLYDEFKAFAFKGNVIDLAVGVIIGGAFSSIIKSLVDNLIMPLVSVILPGDRRFEHWELVILGKHVFIGKFLGDVVNFLIVAAILFLFIVKFLGWIMKEKKIEEAAPPPPTKDQALLMEIRDLLKQRLGEAPAGETTDPPPATA